jgi:hypothetical protein
VWVRLSTNGGASYDSANNYGHVEGYFSPTGMGNEGANDGTASALCATGGLRKCSNDPTKGGYTGYGKLIGPGSTTGAKRFYGQGTHYSVTDTFSLGLLFSGVYIVSGLPVNALRVQFDTGNIASGIVRIYGLGHG